MIIFLKFFPAGIISKLLITRMTNALSDTLFLWLNQHSYLVETLISFCYHKWIQIGSQSWSLIFLRTRLSLNLTTRQILGLIQTICQKDSLFLNSWPLCTATLDFWLWIKLTGWLSWWFWTQSLYLSTGRKRWVTKKPRVSKMGSLSSTSQTTYQIQSLKREWIHRRSNYSW